VRDRPRRAARPSAAHRNLFGRAAIGAAGDLLAFISSLYLASSPSSRGDGWALGVLAVTSVAWLAAIPALRFHVPNIGSWPRSSSGRSSRWRASAARLPLRVPAPA
jgi:hypothetical protein